MQHGAILLWEPGRRAVFAERVRRARDLGYDAVGVGDSPNSYRDWTLALGVAAGAAPGLRLVSTVATPHGRHPVATASALSALQELSGGRTTYGVGTGGSAAAATGRAAATLAEVREHLVSVRSLLRGEAAEVDGRTCPPMEGTVPVPLVLSAYGPAAMRLAGEVADGVILAVGAAPDLIAGFRAEVARGAEAAGRDPAEVAVWVMARVAVRDDHDEALTDVQANLASAGAFGLRSSAQMATVPDAVRDRVLELQRRYDPTQHVKWDGPNGRLVRELDLGGYLAERFGVVGTPSQCRAQVAALADAGVDGLLLPAVDRDPEGLLERFAAAVA